MEIFGLVLIIFLFFLLVPGFICFANVRKISIKHYESNNPDNDKNILKTENAAEWATENGFDFVGYYIVKAVCMSVFTTAWKSKEKPTFLCQYNIYNGSRFTGPFDFATDFKNEIELTTCSSKDAHFFPKPPGIFVQSFSAVSLDELFTRHLEAEEYILKEGRAQFHDSQISFEKSFISYLKRENHYQRKYWYRYFFVLYYFFIRKNKFHNKTIRQQHELGMIQLPDMILERLE